MEKIIKKLWIAIMLPFIITGCSSDNGGTDNNNDELPSDEMFEIAQQTSLSFATGGIHAVALQNDGKIIIASQNIYRLNPDGSTDSSFNADASLPVINAPYFVCKSIALQNDGKILLGYHANNGTNQVLFRLNPNGSLDQSFSPNIKGQLATSSREVNSILPLSDGNIVIGGTFAAVDGVSMYHLSKLNDTGRLVNGFNPGTYLNIANNVSTITSLPNNRFLVTGGLFTSEALGAIPRANAIVFDYNGNVDASFNFTEDLWVQHPVPDLKRIYAVSPVSDGSFIFGGNFNSLMQISGSGTKLKDIAFEENYRKINSIASLDNDNFLIGSSITGLPIGYTNYDKFFSIYNKSANTITNIPFNFEHGNILKIIKETNDTFLLIGSFEEVWYGGEVVNILRVKVK